MPENNSISKHVHFGPYSDLKNMTWDKPEVTENYIAGTIQNLKDLKEIIASKLSKTQIGETFEINNECGINNTATLKFFVMNDDFDPVSLDCNYN